MLWKTVVRKFWRESRKVSYHCLVKKISKVGSVSGRLTKASAAQQMMNTRSSQIKRERGRVSTEPSRPVWVPRELRGEELKELCDLFPAVVLDGVDQVIPEEGNLKLPDALGKPGLQPREELDVQVVPEAQHGAEVALLQQEEEVLQDLVNLETEEIRRRQGEGQAG